MSDKSIHSRRACAIVGATAGALLLAGPAAAGQCRDPWITQAIHEVTGRWPNGNYEGGECTYTQYGGGHWNSYAQLKQFVQQRFGLSVAPPSGAPTINSSTYQALPKSIRNGQTFAFYQGAWRQVVAQGGGNLKMIGQDGASILVEQGANLH